MRKDKSRAEKWGGGGGEGKTGIKERAKEKICN